MGSRVIKDTKDTCIQPEHINTENNFFDAFDHTETEVSARWIVSFLQENKKGWAPFTYEEINAFYARKYQHGFRFNRLVEPEMVPPSLARAFAGIIEPKIPVGGGWIVLGEDKKYRVTEDFVLRCYKSSPARTSA